MSELRVNSIRNQAGTGAVSFPSGIDVSANSTIAGKVRSGVYGSTIVSTDVSLTASDINQTVLVNTASARNITLPAGSSLQIGDSVRIVDIGSSVSNGGNAFVRNITIIPNAADCIQGGTAGDSLIMDVNAQAITLMWCGSSYDWRLV